MTEELADRKPVIDARLKTLRFHIKNKELLWILPPLRFWLKELSSDNIWTPPLDTARHSEVFLAGIGVSSMHASKQLRCIQTKAESCWRVWPTAASLEVRWYLWRSSLCCGPHRYVSVPGRQCGTPHSGSRRTGRRSHTRAQTRAGTSPGRRTRRGRFPPSRRTAGPAHSRSSGRDFPPGRTELEEQKRCIKTHMFWLGCIYTAGATCTSGDQ